MKRGIGTAETHTSTPIEGSRAMDEFRVCQADVVLAKLPDAIAVVDMNGVLTYASPAAETLLGVQAAHLVGSNAFDLVHPDDQLDAFEGFESTLSSAASRAT